VPVSVGKNMFYPAVTHAVTSAITNYANAVW